MNIGKKELRLIILLGIVLYAFIFYKFVWTTKAPLISQTSDRILSLEKEKASLDEQYANMDAKKAQLTAKSTLNERIDEYLMNSVNMVDSLEYVDKLAALVGENIAEMNIGKPEERYTTSKNNPLKSETDLNTPKQNGQRYYESRIDFRAYMTNERAMQLIKYIEGGTQKVKITKFAIKPLKDNKLPPAAGTTPAKPDPAAGAGAGTAAQTPAGDPAAQEKLFEVDMTISLYSLNIRSLDRMFEYNRHKLNRFMNTGGIMFEEVQLSQGNLLAENLALLDSSLGMEDIVIREQSYLTAGENLEIFGADREKVLRLKTDKPLDVNIRFEENSYNISAPDSLKKTRQISGSLPKKDLITMKIVVDMPVIEENKNIRLNLHIANNSDKKINISLDDKQNRVKINDRKGKTIFGDDSAEHVNIL